MDRFRALALIVAVAPSVALGQAGNPAPVLTMSIDAPAQPDSPVHIIGFKNSRRELSFDLLNSSDKTVTSVILGNVSWIPSGCSTANAEERSMSHTRFPVRIGPHGSGAASSKYVHYPMVLISSARDLATAHLLTQFVVDAVYFEDGTTWPTALSSSVASELGPFDPLSEAETGKCADIGAVVDALRPIEEVTFDHEGAAVGARGNPSRPHMRYSCSLEGPKAICHMPLDKDSSSAPRQ